MARTWLQIKVELLGGLGTELDPPPGRMFAVGPSVTFERLAQTINVAFGRWDLGHLHSFDLADGQRIGYPDVDDDRWLDHTTVKVGTELKPGDRFDFTFDFGDDWRHRCQVLDDKIDPRETDAELRHEPTILWGWGWLPDQYGRTEAD